MKATRRAGAVEIEPSSPVRANEAAIKLHWSFVNCCSPPSWCLLGARRASKYTHRAGHFEGVVQRRRAELVWWGPAGHHRPDERTHRRARGDPPDCMRHAVRPRIACLNVLNRLLSQVVGDDGVHGDPMPAVAMLKHLGRSVKIRPASRPVEPTFPFAPLAVT